jgi:hypothetical protein
VEWQYSAVSTALLGFKVKNAEYVQQNEHCDVTDGTYLTLLAMQWFTPVSQEQRFQVMIALALRQNVAGLYSNANTCCCLQVSVTVLAKVKQET